MTRTVVFHIMNCGKGVGKKNTPSELRQLSVSGEAHHRGTELNAAYCSDMPCINDALEYILQVRDEGLKVVPHEAFFAREMLTEVFGAELRRLGERIGKHATAEDWLKEWPQSQVIAERITKGMRGIASDIVRENEMRRMPWHVLVGYHAPLCGLAAIKPHDIGPIGFADIVRYTLRHNGSTWSMISSLRLPCPTPNKSRP